MEYVPACLLSPFIWSQVAGYDSPVRVGVKSLESIFLDPLFHFSSLWARREC